MSDNQKISPKKGFLKRNSFIIIFIAVLVIGSGYLYINNKGIIQNIFKINEVSVPMDVVKEINPNQDLETKVANLENLIRELASTIQTAQSQSPEPQIIQPQQNIIKVKDLDAYELLKSMNLILLNIDNQQIRNSNVTKLQSQFMFFTESRLQSLLSLPDSTFTQQQLLKNEARYIKEDFLKNSQIHWFKKVTQNIFKISVSRKITNPMGSFMMAVENGNYLNAVIHYKNLTPNQKIFFQETYEIANSYENQKTFLENLF
ncbi:MAG: hypothetical protein O3C61_01725 [Proteobacteria bacterium]|nr:hypothetical protein [Pseudomonadota bacterium]